MEEMMFAGYVSDAFVWCLQELKGEKGILDFIKITSAFDGLMTNIEIKLITNLIEKKSTMAKNLQKGH